LATSDIAAATTNTNRSDRLEITFDFGDIHDGVAAVTDAQTNPYSTLFPNIEDVKEQIKICETTKYLYYYLKDGSLPENEKLARQTIYESDQYVLGTDDTLYHLHVPRSKHLNRVNATVKKLVIPAALRHHIAVALHDFHCHLGIQRC